jgi:hypothetical protein
MESEIVEISGAGQGSAPKNRVYSLDDEESKQDHRPPAGKGLCRHVSILGCGTTGEHVAMTRCINDDAPKQ